MALGPASAKAEIEFSAGLQISSSSDFYQPLTPYGSWVDISYGRCWHPVEVAPDWRPYCNGQWVWTDCGWYWESDEPWSWACYHYGSWVDDPTYGWCWIPGTEWAPAWVVWRSSPDYVGWAPCGPDRAVLAPSFFTFVDVHHFHDRISRRELIINDPRIIEHTTVINDFRHETRDIGGVRERIVVNQGPGVDPIRRVTGRNFEARPISQVVTQTRVPEGVRMRSDEHIEHPRLQRSQALPRTGREQLGNSEQPRNYQQPQNLQNSQQPRNYEQPRNYQPSQNQQNTQPQRNYEQPRNSQQQRSEPPRVMPEQPRSAQPGTSTTVPRYPETPERRTPSLPSTGREQPREYPLPNQPAPREVPRTEPNVPQRPVTPPSERALPPTGRERGYGEGASRSTPAEVTPRAPVREAPGRPQGPPAGDARGQQQGNGKDKQQE